MQRFKLSIRLAVSIVALVTLLIVASQNLGIIPNRLTLVQLERKSVCETIAVQCSLSAQRNDTAGMQQSVRFMTSRYPDIAFLSVVSHEKGLLVREGPDQLVNDLLPGTIAANIPILLDEQEWGNVRVVFQEPDQSLLAKIQQDPALSLSAFFLTIGLVVFSVYSWVLSRGFASTSSHDLPDRVRDTLNSLSEGILVLDPEHRVAFANDAFCQVSGRAEDEMIGLAADRMVHRDEPCSLLPWESATDGKSDRATLRVNGADAEEHSMSVRSTALLADDGEFFGSLATFDDLTTIEQMNRRLKRLVGLLKESRKEIRRQNVELEKLSSIDPLTQCLNRRSFYEKFDLLLSLARRQSSPLSCVMLDIDHFKSINDNFGHAKGDQVLAKVAHALRDAVRESDLVCRYGGEEFCVILTNTDVDAAHETSDRIRRLIEDLNFDDLSVTVSLGVSALSLGADDAEQLIDQADQALYAAKGGGRNRVVAFTPLGDTSDHSCQSIESKANETTAV